MDYAKTAVTSNSSEKGLNSVLDFISTSKENKNLGLVEQVFTLALSALKDQGNEVLHIPSISYITESLV